MSRPDPSTVDDDAIPTTSALQVQGVSKKFARSLRRSLVLGLSDLGRNLVGRPMLTTELRKGEFWAVDDVTLDIEQGEKVGLMGVNGCGKTTLMRMIAGILPPDRGRVAVRGRLSALIAVGTGFHPHLSGLENIYLNGSLLGLQRSEIDEVLDDILAFADLGDFVDSPVGMYSNGMRARLGFAVATTVDPDVLILDEVLAVGDMAFRQRCFRHLDRLSPRTALLLVTHLPTHIRRVCDRVIWLADGRIVADGPVDDVLEEYSHAMADIDDRYAIETGQAHEDQDWI